MPELHQFLHRVLGNRGQNRPWVTFVNAGAFARLVLRATHGQGLTIHFAALLTERDAGSGSCAIDLLSVRSTMASRSAPGAIRATTADSHSSRAAADRPASKHSAQQVEHALCGDWAF